MTSGETVFSIANRYGTTVDRIRIDNALLPTQELLIGQALLILIPTEVYTVQSKDTLNNISQMYGISVRTLLRNNPSLRSDATLYPGQTIVITYEKDKRGNILTNGYAYPFINEQALRQVLPYLSMITPFTVGIREDGTLIPISDSDIRTQAASEGTERVLLISTLGEDDRFNSELPGRIFANPLARERFITEAVNTALQGGYRYIDIDFEFIPASQAINYANFINDLRMRANQSGIMVIVALAPKNRKDQPGLLYEGHLYPELGANADYVLLMTYEWGYTFGPPQAVAPLDKVKQVVEYAVSEIPSEKILLGIPNYGYDWLLPYESGVSRAVSLGNVEAVRLAAEYNQPILFDSIAATPYFYYTARDGGRHVVWFEDVRSILGKLNLISEYNLAGLSAWTVMRWFPGLWLTVNDLFDITE